MHFQIPRLYAIIDAAATRGRSPAAVSDILISAGVLWIQYRNKLASSCELFERSREILGEVRRVRALSIIRRLAYFRLSLPLLFLPSPRPTLIVNDRADVARAVDADGVHLGQDDLPVELARRQLGRKKLIGVSTHNLSQLREADASSADYIAFGPIFSTRSKEKPDPVVGLEGLREARKATRKPLVAIGGITVENAQSVIEAGADSVAVIHGLLGAADLATRAREFLQAVTF